MTSKLFSGLLAGALTVGTLGFSPSAGAATLETFMHIDGIPGESVVKGHENDIILIAYSQSFGTKNCSRVMAYKNIDSSSPALIGNAAGNVLIPTVIITIRKDGEVPIDVFKATLQTVLVERIDVTGDSSVLREQVTLRPRSIHIEYRAQDSKGAVGPPIVTDVVCN